MLRPRAALAAVFATAISVWAVGPAAAQAMNQVPLTPAIVEAVIASYPAVKQTADDLSAQYGNVGGGGGDPGAAFGAWMAVSAAHGALNGTVQQYGFADYATWVNTLTSVVFAYTFAGEGGGMDAQMAEAVAGIQNNPNLSDAQKEMMLQQIQASFGALSAIRPPQQNVDAVAPYADQLAVIFEN
jgi:hypothetical protein